MNCPWCDSPVTIYGSQWECGWCGDFGWLTNIPTQNRTSTQVKITLKLSFAYHIDLTEKWSGMKKALCQLAPENNSLSQLLGKVLLHSISEGIRHAALPDEKKGEELRAFMSNTPDLMLGESAETIMRGVRQGVLFREEAALSAKDCGAFWMKLISTRPAEEYYNDIDPIGLYELLSELSDVYAYFGESKNAEISVALKYQNALQEAYYTHRRDCVLLRPDIERAKRLLSEGKIPDNEDVCREILLVQYPEDVPHETAEIFNELSWEYILDDVFAQSTAKGVKMWRSLLDVAATSLKDDPDTAKKLLLDWDWLNTPKQDQVLPLLLALKDERFVSQIFGSAIIGRLQLDVLRACHEYGQEELGQHCLEVALQNPYLEKHWEKHLKRVFTASV